MLNITLFVLGQIFSEGGGGGRLKWGKGNRLRSLNREEKVEVYSLTQQLAQNQSETCISCSLFNYVAVVPPPLEVWRWFKGHYIANLV